MAGRFFVAVSLATITLAFPNIDVEPIGLHYTHGAAWIPTGQSLETQLPQEATNGKSVHGTLDARNLPEYIHGDGSPMPSGCPWGEKTARYTNPYQDAPYTGMTRNYEFNVSKGVIAPDGVKRPTILVNGAFPGPTIEANWGDWIQVTVNNDLEEGTALHWHGFLQRGTPWFDGVPSVDQCPLPPGSSFTYRFRAELYGSSWYHSHYSAQTAGGLFGPIVIYGPHDNAEYDDDIGVVLINDWFHEDYISLLEQAVAPISDKTFPPTSSNSLINGKMNYPCKANDTACTPNAGISKFRFVSGKTYRLRLINSGAEALQKFSIDSHQMTVIANDFVPVVPYDVGVVTLGVGQRTDIIVKATGKPTDAVWMRSTVTSTVKGGCALTDEVSPVAVAAIYYENADTSSIPTSTSNVTTAVLKDCSNDPLGQTTPYYSIAAESNATEILQIDITFRPNSNGTHVLWYMNNNTFRADYENPVLLGASRGELQYKPDWNVLDIGSNGGSVRLVVYNHDTFAGAHPMHLHGHNFQILAEGSGKWNGLITNAENPQRRDTQMIAQGKNMGTPAYMVIQFEQDNPGVWPFHCHVAWHLSNGFYINFLEDADALKKMHIPSTLMQSCRDWDTWTSNHPVDEIGDGL